MQKRSKTGDNSGVHESNHAQAIVRYVPKRLSALPPQLHRHIAYFLSPHKVRKADDLESLVKWYPIEYLCVDFRLPADEQRGVVSILSQQDCVLKEVVVTHLDYSEFAMLVEALLELQHLECLSLQLCNVASSSAEDFARQCCNSRNKCHFFDLDLSSMTAEMACPIVEKLVRADKCLTYLDLRRIDGWKDAHNQYLSFLKSKAVNLAHLRFIGVEFGEHGARLMADALAKNCSLQSLRFGDGPIGDDGVSLIADALSRNTVLQRFRGYNLGMTPAGAAKLASALLVNNTLVHFILRDEDVGVQGAKVFAKVLEVNRSLRNLGLNYCELGREGCHAIVNALEKNDVLEKLDIAYNGMSDLDAQRLLTMPGKRWWSLYIDERNRMKSLKPTSPFPTQFREEFENNFREHKYEMKMFGTVSSFSPLL